MSWVLLSVGNTDGCCVSSGIGSMVSRPSTGAAWHDAESRIRVPRVDMIVAMVNVDYITGIGMFVCCCVI